MRSTNSRCDFKKIFHNFSKSLFTATAAFGWKKIACVNTTLIEHTLLLIAAGTHGKVELFLMSLESIYNLNVLFKLYRKAKAINNIFYLIILVLKVILHTFSELPSISLCLYSIKACLHHSDDRSKLVRFKEHKYIFCIFKHP